MWGKIATRLACGLLKTTWISTEDRQLLTAAILDKLHAIPLRDRITVDGTGKVSVDGRPVKMDVANALVVSSRSMLSNFARKFVRDQVTFMAVKMGVHENLTPEQGFFAKAVLWVMQEEDKLYQHFAGADVAEDDERQPL